MDNNEDYIKLYDSIDEYRDEQRFIEAEKNGDVSKIDWGAFSRLIKNDLCFNTNIINTGYIGRVKLSDVELALKNPRNNGAILMRASEELMRVSPHYYRLNSMYSNMALFCWWIDLYGIKPKANVATIKDVYGKLAEKFETMNIKYEFSKIMRCLPYQDIYCGLVVEDDVSFYFQKINFGICRLYQIEDGLFNFQIDLSKINSKELNGYPIYVQEEYINFIEGKTKCRWYTPPSDLQICIKMNSQWNYPMPILINLIQDILDLDTYKKLKLQSARTDNYRAIMIKVPIDETTVDKPLLTPDTLGIFASINRENMTDDIGLIHTLGSDGEAISFKNSTNTTNNVSEAIDEIYNSAGSSKDLFNGSATGTAITLSIENDSGLIYSVYRQFERWANRYIRLRKYNKKLFKFNFYLLDVTVFNRDNVSSRYREACTLGATVIDKWLASIDMTPSRTLGSYVLHNNIFDFQNNFVPLASSYNAAESSSNEGGRPTNKEKGELLTEEGERTADGEKNDR